MASNNKNSLLLFLLLIVALLLNYGFCHQQQDNDSSSPIEQVDDGDDDNNHGNHSAIWWTVFLLSVGCAIICAVLIKGQSEPAEQNANNDQNEGQGDGEIAGGGVNLDDIDMDFIDGEIDYQATWGHNPFEHGGGNLLQNLQEQNIDEQEEEKDPCCPGSQKMVSLMANYVDTFAHSFSKSSLFDRMFPQSLSLSVLWLLALSNFATASGAVQHYDGFKLLRVIPQTLEQLAALRNFSEYVGLQPNSGAEVWNFRPFVGQPSEFFAAPDNAKRVTDFIKFDSIGKTSEGREIPFLTLGYPSKTSKKPALFLDAGIHAREWIAPAIALHFINALINEPKFHSLLSDIDVHVLPSLNPDGYTHSANSQTQAGVNKCPCSFVNLLVDRSVNFDADAMQLKYALICRLVEAAPSALNDGQMEMLRDYCTKGPFWGAPVVEVATEEAA